MYRTSSPEEYEPPASVVTTAIAPEALIYVGALSVVAAVFVVSCHLYRVFARHGDRTLFDADDKLILGYFYAVIVVFAAVAVF